MRRTALALASALVLTTAATAGFLDGNELMERCDDVGGTYYLMGLIDQDQWLTTGYDAVTGEPVQLKMFVCVPDNVLAEQARDIVCYYLRDNPSERHYSAAYLARVALHDAWPCP